MTTFANRILGSVRLDARSFEEIETDPQANFQAFGIVILSSIAAALGAGIRNPGGMVALLAVSLITWLTWVALTLFIGTQLLPGQQTRSDFGQMLRTTGFSAAPGIFRVLGVIPIVGWVLFLGATVWMLCSFVIAIRQALDYTSTGKAVAVCLLGWIIHVIVLFGFVFTAH